MLWRSLQLLKNPCFVIIWSETKKKNCFMATHLYEEVKRLLNLVCRLATEIDLKNQRIEHTEERSTELSTLNQANAELSLSLSRMTEERDQLNEANLEEMRNIQRIVYENETQQHKEIDKREAQLDLKSKKLSVLSEEVTRKINIVQRNSDGAKNSSSGENVQALAELNAMFGLTLIAKECRSNHGLQNTRKALMEVINPYPTGFDGFANICTHPVIGIKLTGELNEKPFLGICIQKFPTSEWDTKSAELCSLWQKKIQDSEWYPYKHVTIDDKLRCYNEDDEMLRCFVQVYDAVTAASLEINQYNASGRYPVRELWNFKEDMEASLKEVMEYVLQKLKALKGVSVEDKSSRCVFVCPLYIRNLFINCLLHLAIYSNYANISG
ncbi:hypothetical protein MKW94_026312 [Papaver nudicaule]|uniref:Factor of DNA methylation 1-5/IDN2 domain-containing protein n=1 Tax=Papaver nudicaule TaxID=74823 RepID=A0AA41RRL4_PAPNU|nr:hypothetical protein [Papaver nudicaule]